MKSETEVISRRERNCVFCKILNSLTIQCSFIMISPSRFFNNPSTRHRTSTRYRPKPLSQRNLLSAFFGLTSVVFLATALVEPRWFFVKGGKCSGHFLGIYKMLSLKTTNSLRKSCYSADTVLKLKIIMAFLCCGALLSFISCLLDIWGPKKRLPHLFRSNSIGNIITVIMSVASCAFAYWVAVSIKNYLKPAIGDSPVHIRVSFSYSFYLVVAAGTCALSACAVNMISCNCRRNGDQFSSEEELRAELMNSMESALPSTIRGEPPPVYSA